MTEDPKTPLDAVVELALFAPLGLALTARDHLPELIARGRQQLNQQVTLARMMGKYAVKEGEKDLRKRVGDLSETLSGLGLLPEPNPKAPAASASTSMPMPPPETVDVTVPTGSAKGSSNSSSNGSGATTPAEVDPPLRSRADLSIPGYDTLSASQVVQRLAGLSARELADVEDYESGTRGRRTILSKIAQLQSGPST